MDVIKPYFFALLLLLSGIVSAQTIDSLSQFKKKVLESVEVDILMSYYQQEGIHAAVSGGIGNEYLTNYAPTIVVRIPLNEDAVLTADVGISAYTSASSSNGNPFNQTGASASGDDNYNTPRGNGSAYGAPKGSPWIASTGASAKDELTTVNIAYKKVSDDRLLIRGLANTFMFMRYTPDNANYKNYKKYFPKRFNDKLVKRLGDTLAKEKDTVRKTFFKQHLA